MEKYSSLVEALSAPPISITQDYVNSIMDSIVETATEMHKNNPQRSLDDIIQKCKMGTIIEHAMKIMLANKNIFSRFSKQKTWKDREYDIACLIRTAYENGDDEVKIDTKSCNVFCRGEYFAFNCYDKNDPKAYEAQRKRSGANLNYFINVSHDTELLLIVDMSKLENGDFIITPTYLIHRDAFKSKFKVSRYLNKPDNPYYYFIYSDMIKAGHCVRIKQKQ